MPRVKHKVAWNVNNCFKFAIALLDNMWTIYLGFVSLFVFNPLEEEAVLCLFNYKFGYVRLYPSLPWCNFWVFHVVKCIYMCLCCWGVVLCSHTYRRIVGGCFFSPPLSSCILYSHFFILVFLSTPLSYIMLCLFIQMGWWKISLVLMTIKASFTTISYLNRNAPDTFLQRNYKVKTDRKMSSINFNKKLAKMRCSKTFDR